LRRLATFETPDGPIHLMTLGLSADGTLLAATTDHSLIAIWNLRQLRQELAALDLDWEMPPYPTGKQDAGPSANLTMEVLSAPTSPH